MNLLAKAFLVAREADGCSKATLTWHKSSLSTFYSWLDESGYPHTPDEWSLTLLREYVVYLQCKTSSKGKPLSGTSVTTYVQSLKAFTRWLFLEEFTTSNVAERLKKPRPPQTQKQPYSNDELKRMLAAVKGSARDHAILTILIDCGLRAQELCNLKRHDINFTQQLLHVRLGKGAKDRTVPFSTQTAKALSKFLAKADTEDLFLFSTSRSAQFTPNALLQLVIRVGKAANVERPSVHRFRHCFALSWLRNGGDVVTLQKVMGHADLATTQVYLALSTEDLQRSHLTASPLTNLMRGK